MQPLDAERVREWRHRRMLSQQEVADRAGTSLFTIQRIERGEGNVRPRTGRGVAAALGVPIEELLPKVQAPLFRELPESAAEDERRSGWDAHVASARQLREPARARMEALVSSWRKSKERREAADARHEIRDEMGQLLQEAFDARSALVADASGNTSRLDLMTIPIAKWNAITEADTFYWALREKVEGAGLYIRTKSAQEGEAAREGQPKVHKVREVEKAA